MTFPADIKGGMNHRLWKNVTFLIGLFLLLLGAKVLDYPDWDFTYWLPVSHFFVFPMVGICRNYACQMRA